MNTRKLFAVAAIALAGSAFASASSAGEGDFAPVPASSLTREQVKAELKQSIASGEQEQLESNTPPLTLGLAPAQSNLTRAQVRAETRAYARSPQGGHNNLLIIGN